MRTTTIRHRVVTEGCAAGPERDAIRDRVTNHANATIRPPPGIPVQTYVIRSVKKYIIWEVLYRYSDSPY